MPLHRQSKMNFCKTLLFAVAASAVTFIPVAGYPSQGNVQEVIVGASDQKPDGVGIGILAKWGYLCLVVTNLHEAREATIAVNGGVPQGVRVSLPNGKAALPASVLIHETKDLYVGLVPDGFFADECASAKTLADMNADLDLSKQVFPPSPPKLFINSLGKGANLIARHVDELARISIGEDLEYEIDNCSGKEACNPPVGGFSGAPVWLKIDGKQPVLLGLHRAICKNKIDCSAYAGKSIWRATPIQQIYPIVSTWFATHPTKGADTGGREPVNAILHVPAMANEAVSPPPTQPLPDTSTKPTEAANAVPVPLKTPQQSEMATLVPQAQDEPQDIPLPSDAVATDFVAAAQRELARLNCYSGSSDARWGKASMGAFERFRKAYGVKETTPSDPDDKTVALLKTYEPKACPQLCRSGELLKAGRCVRKETVSAAPSKSKTSGAIDNDRCKVFNGELACKP